MSLSLPLPVQHTINSLHIIFSVEKCHTSLSYAYMHLFNGRFVSEKMCWLSNVNLHLNTQFRPFTIMYRRLLFEREFISTIHLKRWPNTLAFNEDVYWIEMEIDDARTYHWSSIVRQTHDFRKRFFTTSSIFFAPFLVNNKSACVT